MKEEPKKIFIVVILCFVLIALVCLMVYLADIAELKNKQKDKEANDIYWFDMKASCYRGCMFATQPSYDITPIEDKEVRIKLYDDCGLLCEDRYGQRQD